MIRIRSPAASRAAATSAASASRATPSGPQPSLIAVKPASRPPPTPADFAQSGDPGVGVDAHDQGVLGAVVDRLDVGLPQDDRLDSCDAHGCLHSGGLTPPNLAAMVAASRAMR